MNVTTFELFGILALIGTVYGSCEGLRLFQKLVTLAFKSGNFDLDLDLQTYKMFVLIWNFIVTLDSAG